MRPGVLRRIGAGLGVAMVAAGLGAWLLSRQPETTAAMRGREVARRLGCFACHGPDGRGGVADPAAPGERLPGWDGASASLYLRDAEQIREWILYGAPREPAGEGGPGGPAGLVPMPAYEGFVGGQDLEDLTAFFLAASGWAMEMPEAAYEGRKVALRMGCFGCHGPSGMGGASNPGSYTGRIPAWTGDGFAELVRDEAELRAWILDGHPPRLWENPIARGFLESQLIQMPAYRQHLSEADLERLVAYTDWLRR